MSTPFPHRLLVRALVAMIVFGVFVLPSQGQAKMYWTDVRSGAINRADLDGSHMQQIASAQYLVRDIQFDMAKEYVYWLSGSSKQIIRAKLDGSHQTILVKMPDGSPQSLVLDLPHNVMYWAMSDSSDGHGVWRAGLDGTGVTKVLNFRVKSMALDQTHGDMYWCDWVPIDVVGQIHMNDLVVEQIFREPDLGTPWDIAVDVHAEHFFWVDGPGPNGIISRADFDGANRVDVINPSAGLNPRAIALDPSAGKMYIAGYTGIHVANLDGSNLHPLVTNVFAEAIAVTVPEPSVMGIVLAAEAWIFRRRRLAGPVTTS